MLKSRLLALATTLAFAVMSTPAAALADVGELEPGLWQVVSQPMAVQVDDPSVTPEVQAEIDQAMVDEAPESEQMCVTAADLAEGAFDLFGPAGTTGQPVPATLSNGTLTSSFEVGGDQGVAVTMTLAGSYQPTSFTATRTIKVAGDQPVTVAMSLTGTRLGDCPAAD